MVTASERIARPSFSDRLLALTIHPGTIVVVAGIGAFAIAGARGLDLVPWVIFVAGIAGWSSAWSP